MTTPHDSPSTDAEVEGWYTGDEEIDVADSEIGGTDDASIE